MAPTLPGFQGINICVKYLASQPHKPIFHYSNSYYGSNTTRLTWSVNKVEDHTTQNCLGCHQDADHAIIINRIRLASGIIRLFPTQDVHFFYTCSHLSALLNCALIFSTNFQFIFTFKKCTTQVTSNNRIDQRINQKGDEAPTLTPPRVKDTNLDM